MKLLLLFPLLLACGPSFRDIQKDDTIEGYEAFIAEVSESHPDHYKAVLRLEEKYLAQARDQKSLEGYDVYLSKYKENPKALLLTLALDERQEFLYEWATTTNTIAGWEKYLSEYPRAKKKRKQEARRRIKMLGYADSVSQGEIRMERLNLAEDPEGPLNGWGVWCDFTNNGDRTIDYLNVQIEWLNNEGGAVQTRTWPLVAPKYPVPIEEEYLVPIEAGEVRTFFYMSDEPESAGWVEKMRLTPVAIKLAGEDSSEG